jgi:uncharacterized membrane protein
MTVAPWAVGLTLLSTIVGAFSPVILKRASGRVSLDFMKLVKDYRLIGGLILGGVSVIIFVPALKGGELSLLYPMTSLTYVWVSLLSVRFLNERMNYLKWFGVVCIMAGVFLLSLGSA